MKSLLGFLILTAATASALVNDVQEECMVTTPIGNTIVQAGDKMKIMWTNSKVKSFPTIFLVQTDGTNKSPIVLASKVDTSTGKIEVDLAKNLVPSNAYYLTLGEAPHHCQTGNLRIVPPGAIMPPSKPPPGLGNHSPSEGTYAKPDPTASNAKSMVILPVTFAATVLVSFVFMLTL